MCLVTAGGQGSLLLSHWSIHHPLHLTRTTISSFHIWVSFRSQNPIWSHHPWTTPPFINNKSFSIYSHQKIFPYLSLSFFFFFYRVKHANHNSAHQLALSPATQTPHMYLPRGGLPTSLTPPSLITTTYPPFTTRHANPLNSLSLCPLHIIIYHRLSPWFSKSNALSYSQSNLKTFLNWLI